jgi:hypothetical protein
MAHLEEFTEYKNTLMKAICTSDTIVGLLKLETDKPDITGREMRYDRIFPYNYVPLTTQNAKTFVCFVVTAPNVKDGIVTDLTLTVFVFTHQDIMRTDKGMRTDLLVSEIDKLLNGSTDYGLGKVKLKMCDVLQVPVRGYSGLFSVYTVKDFNYSICGQY